jgi:hypothetical protein
MKTSFVDKILNKLISRKLMVWLTATGLMYAELGITSEDWVAISLMYVGIQGLGDIAAQWKHRDND